MLMAAVAATPALAQTDFTLTNALSQAVTGVNTYPLDEKGEPVEENIGGFFNPLASGAKITFTLDSTACETVLMVISIDGQSEFRPIIDLCAKTAVTIRN